jgi:2-polyprenyl-3-methyl-5-hydroxy-6-metoxy-1,4-benzoquinol methylase
VSSEPEDDKSAYWAHKRYKFEMYGAEDVKADYDQRYRSILDRVLKVAGPVRSVVDFGCGSGNFLSFAERQGLEATGVDLDAAAVAAACDRGLRAFVPGELDSNLADRSVDMVTLWDVIEHIPDPEGFMSDVLRKVRPGGILVLETPDATFPVRPVARFLHYATAGRIRLVRRMYYWEHKVYFSVEGLRRLLAAQGCEVLAVVKLTSPKAKMSRLFEMSASSGRLDARVISRCWPFFEAVTRRLGAGNKIILVGRTQSAAGSA